MNKKFSTLVAALLMTSAFSVDAQYVKINPANLIEGTYVLANAKGDSVLNPAATPAVVKADPTAASKYQVTFKKDGAKWKIVANKKELKFDTSWSFDTSGDALTITPAKDSTLTIKDGSNFLTRNAGKVGNTTKAYAGSNFTLYAVPVTVKDQEVADVDVLTQTFWLYIDGKYVGYQATEASALRAAAGEGIQLVDALPTDGKDAFAWIKEGNAIKNIVTGKYLTVDKSNNLTLSETPVATSKDGNALLIGTKVVGSAAYLESTVAIPFEQSKQFVAAKADANKVLLFVGDKVLNKDYKLVSYNPNDAADVIWNLSLVETTKGKHEVRLTNGDVKLTAGNDYVVVSNAIISEKDGKYSYALPTDGVILLKAGDKFVAINEDEVTTVAAQGQATEVGFGQTGSAFLTAADLLVRYRDYFKMSIIYDKDGNDETDLTSIFEGNLIPIKNASYSNGYFRYDVAGASDKSFMLINEKEEILVMNTNPDANISSAKDVHVRPLTTVSAKEYFLDQADKKHYDASFRFEFTPGTTGDNVTSADAIYVGSHKLGAYKDGQNFILVAADEVTTLLPVKIEINKKQNVVDPTAWLTKVAYYTVEVVNKNKDSYNYGKVLGLNEDGDVAYVNPAKTNIALPEGQWAISYIEVEEGGKKVTKYVFKNRETGRQRYFNAESLYKTSVDNVFAYYTDTLAIKSVTNFSSEDGFRRLTANELNDSTYTVAMSLLDDSYLYVVENHKDKHRLGLDRENATEWRVELSSFTMLDKVNDKLKEASDTLTIATPISYYDAGAKTWRSTAKYINGVYNKKYYNPATELKVITYILKNTENGEYLYGKDANEDAGNSYYVCDEYKSAATRLALKKVGENTVNLVPVYSNYREIVNGYDKYFFNWSKGSSITEDNYVNYYASSMYLADNKIIGGTTSATGVLKDVNRFSATTNDLFVIAPTAAPVYKKLNQGDKIVISRAENNDEVIYEKGEFAGINNIKAYNKINPALYVDITSVNFYRKIKS